MYRKLFCVLTIAPLAATGWAAPLEFSDDFTTVTTYDSAALLAPCYGGPSTKYTLIEALIGPINLQRAVSGGGQWIFTNNFTTQLGGYHLEMGVIGALNVGQPCPDVAGLGGLESTMAFTSDDVCFYGGNSFSPYEISVQGINTMNLRGPDGQPGVAGFDDDQDGTTDEDDECPPAHPTTVGGGYGNSDGTGFWAGLDGAPGFAGVDDDGNGTTDEYGEIRAAGSDDSDDTYRPINWMMFKANVNTSSAVDIEVDLASTNNRFNLREIVAAQDAGLENNNELTPNFYEAYVHYNWVVCVSGTCYGAVLWTEADLANVNEYIGPIKNTNHTNPGDNLVGFATFQQTDPAQYLRRVRFLGCTNFSNTYWAISGDPKVYYPSVSSDLDNDRDVDGQDFLTFSVCYNGSLKAPQPTCANTDADLDDDGDVDGQDFLTFSTCYNGALKRPRPACFPPDLTACL